MSEHYITSEKKLKRRISAWETILIVLGFPLWFTLLVSTFAVLFSLYVSLWAIVVSVWAVFVSVIACAFAGVLAGTGFAILNSTLSGVFLIGAGLVCAGLSIFIFFGCKAVTKGMVFLTKSILLAIKKGFTKKEAA